MIKMLDLFSGAGGLHLASEQAGGYTTVAFSEIDPFACKVLKTRWPEIPNLGDITKIENFPAVDVICGGFPCQDISVASHTRTGIHGSRSGLWVHMVRAISATSPKALLIENSNQLPKKGLDVVLRDIATFGYDAEWYTIPASSIGVPHKRSRTIIIAYRIGVGGGRLVQTSDLSEAGQWLWSGKVDLQAIADCLFLSGPRWPQPLIRRMDDGVADRAYRLGAIGNGVVVPLFQQFFKILKERLAWS